MELAKRGVAVGDTLCRICSVGFDEVNHNFAVCNFAKVVLKRIWEWCQIVSPPDFSTLEDIISYAANWGHCPKKRKIFLAIIYGYVWCLWKMRNDRIFNNICGSPIKVVDNVLSLVYKWVKYRGNVGNLNWIAWCCNPLNSM